MRNTPWIAAVAGCVAAFAAAPTQAQAQFGPGGPGAPGGPSQYAVPPSAGGPPQSGPLPPGVLPGGDLRPFPRISPYENRFNQHFNDGGLWFNETSNAPRKYYGSASYLNGGFKNPNRVEVGSRRRITDIFDQTVLPDVTDPFLQQTAASLLTNDVRWVKSNFFGVLNDDGLIDGYEYYSLSAFQDGIGSEPFRFNGVVLLPVYDASIGLADGQDPSLVPLPLPEPDDFDLGGDQIANQGYVPVTTDALGDNAPDLHGFERALNTRTDEDDHPGLRLRFGLEEADGSGFEMTGEWLSEDTLSYSRGYDRFVQRFDEGRRDIDNGIITTETFAPDQRFRALPLHAILLDFDPDVDATIIQDVPANLGVSTLQPNFIPLAAFTYDLKFEISHSSEQAGTDLAFIGTPFYRAKALRLRPSFGVRYTYTNEEFRFRGRDTGFTTVQDNDYSAFPLDISPDVNIGTTIATGVIQPGFTGSFPGGFLADTLYFPGTLPYESRLTSDVTNHLLGPQAGLHYDLTGEKFAVRGHVKGGLGVVNEEINVTGFGFNIDQGLTGDLMAFNDQRQHTHVSPFLEYNVQASLKLFKYVPFLNRSKAFSNAAVTGGYTIMSLWEVARPEDNIGWREANSGNPFVLDQDRSQLYWQNWDVGLEWRY